MKYADTVLPIIRSTREILLAGWGSADVINRKTESANDVVTATDIAVEDRVASALKQAFPNIPFVGEEAGGDRSAERFWLMDPVDGTAHYVRGMPFCTSMLALIEDGKVVFSVIYDFLNDHLYYAERGGGAFRNEERIRVSDRPLSDSYLCWEMKMDTPESRARYDVLRSKSLMVKTISAGWEHMMIASGKLEGRICEKPWGYDYDFAPGTLLIEEAGGIVANLGTRTFDYRNTDFIAANPVVFKELTEGPDALYPIS